MPLHVSSTCAHHQEVKIALHSLWYHHTYRWPSRTPVGVMIPEAVYVMQFWPPDNEHLCSKHVEAWSKLIVKQKFCASSWLITEINILRCTVSKSSKLIGRLAHTSSTRSPFVTLLSRRPQSGKGCGSPNHNTFSDFLFHLCFTQFILDINNVALYPFKQLDHF